MYITLYVYVDKSKMPPKYFEKDGILCYLQHMYVPRKLKLQETHQILSAILNRCMQKYSLSLSNPGKESAPTVVPIPTASTSSADPYSDSDENVSSASMSSGSGIKKQKKLEDVFTNIKSYTDGGRKNKHITNCIMYMICKGYQPI